MRRPLSRTIARFALGIGLAGGLSLGQVRANDPEVTRIEVDPAPPPTPALRYELTPSMDRTQSGNAATGYLRAVVMASSRIGDTENEQLQQWTNCPLEEFPAEKARELLDKLRVVTEELHHASLCDRIDWGLPLKGRDLIRLNLEEWSNFRKLARLLRVKLRLEIVERRYDEAIQTLRTGFTFGRHQGEGPFLICQLVAMASLQTFVDGAEEFVQAPGAPNLYWALAGLPRPLVTISDWERLWLLSMFPELRDPLETQLTNEQWTDLFRRLLDTLGGSVTGAQTPANDDKRRYDGILMLFSLKAYPAGKELLRESGMAAEAIEALPVPQVVAYHTAMTYMTQCDELFKWLRLPYWQGREGLDQARSRFATELRQREALPLASLLMPAISQVYERQAQLQRQIAKLQIIESLRAYAAANDGAFPPSLEELNATMPAPINPMTGDPFSYQPRDNGAWLQMQGSSDPQYNRTFNIVPRQGQPSADADKATPIP